MIKRVGFWVLYGLAMAGLVVAVDYVLVWRYVAMIEKRQAPREFVLPPHVPEATLRRLGAFTNVSLSAFTRFAPEKPQGVIRIGVFGGSHVAGAEVDESSDFPSQIARLLTEAGIDGVEVLNFGSSWYGMSQSYILWDEVGRNFALDAILIGPMSREPFRDTRFNHSDGGSPYYLHSRFVVEGDELRRLDVIGNTYKQRFRRYYSILPPWRYVRYDRNDPAFLAAALPEGRILGNPFYYDARSQEEEALDIQDRLLRTMIDSGVPVVLGDYPYTDPLRAALRNMAGEHFCAAPIERPKDFPYLAPRGHNSPAGNAFAARQYLSLLLGRPLVAPLLETAPLDVPSARVEAPKQRMLDYEEVRIVVNGIEAGGFAGGPRLEKPSFLRDDDIRTLLALKNRGSSATDGLFLALTAAIDVTAPARLVLATSGGEKDVPLARAPETHDELGFGVIDLPGFDVAAGGKPGVWVPDLKTAFGDPLPAGHLRVVLGDQVLLEGSAEPDAQFIELHPATGTAYRLRSTRSGDVAVDRGSRAGLVEMVLRRAAETVSIPLARWWLEDRTVDPSASCPPEWKPLLAATQLGTAP